MTTFNLKTKEGTKLEATGATPEHLSRIIEGIFGLYTPAQPNTEASDTKSETEGHTVTSRYVSTVTKKDEEPKAVDVHAENPFVREDKYGTPTYRAEYDCPNCGDIGKRFIWYSSDYMKCHKCQCKIRVELTMPEQTNGVPLHDKHGFYFFGNTFFDDQYEEELKSQEEGF